MFALEIDVDEKSASHKFSPNQNMHIPLYGF